MGFLGFESKREKNLRLQLLDAQNEIGRLKAEKEGIPFFGTKYSDSE